MTECLARNLLLTSGPSFPFPLSLPTVSLSLIPSLLTYQ